MQIITVINAKGGCGKSTLAVNLAVALADLTKSLVLLIDLDPQAQLTDWLGMGDGLSRQGSIAQVFLKEALITDLIQQTRIEGLHFIAASQPLEAIGHILAAQTGHESILAEALDTLPPDAYAFAVIDSPNQISPIMENAIRPADLFVAPFESTKAVTSYANFFQLILKLKPPGTYCLMHVLNNLVRPGQRKAVLEAMRREGIEPATIEIRSCGWLARADRYGGSIFHYRPKSRGATDVHRLAEEILKKMRGPPT